MDETLLRLIAALCALAGTGMLLFPKGVARLENALNREWGERPVLSLRVGLPGEERAEAILNTPIHGRRVDWDAPLRRNPRTTGLGLCCAAALLWICA